VGSLLRVRPKIVRIAPGSLAIVAALLSSACGGGDGPDGSCNGCIGGPVNFGVATADFDRSGHAAVAVVGSDVASRTPYIDVYLSGSNGTYAAPVHYTIPANDDSIIAADLNGDGLPDLVGFDSIDTTGQIPILSNDPAHPGTFVKAQTLTAGGPVGTLAVGDLNGDGLADIAVAAGSEIDVFTQQSAAPGTFSGPQVLSSASTGAVAIGDLNGDGIPDLVLSTAGGLVVLFQSNSSRGSYQSVPLGTIVDAGSRFIEIADLDGDGLNDLVVNGALSASGASATLLVLLQDRQNPGHFLAPVSYPVLSDAFNVVVADLSGSGLPDLVVGASDGVSVLLRNAGQPGAFLAALNYTQSDGTGVAVADVNGDGLPDLIVPGVDPPFPAVMLQDAAHPGTFLKLANLGQ
jgi:hypothetical protein